VNLVALYGPEHGLRGGIEGGVKIESGVDERDRASPVHSLYGSTQRPTPAMLRGVDVLLFDMQDIGARPYTFVWTMAMAMEAAAAQRHPVHRAGPAEPDHRRADGGPADGDGHAHGRPADHRLLPGAAPPRHDGRRDRALHQRRVRHRRDLTVVPAAGWRRRQWFDETGLPWIDPSPNIRSLDAALTTPGSCCSRRRT
jgi:uncharacterized protein YbbC (DUF1343 family)